MGGSIRQCRKEEDVVRQGLGPREGDGAVNALDRCHSELALFLIASVVTS